MAPVVPKSFVSPPVPPTVKVWTVVQPAGTVGVVAVAVAVLVALVAVLVAVALVAVLVAVALVAVLVAVALVAVLVAVALVAVLVAVALVAVGVAVTVLVTVLLGDAVTVSVTDAVGVAVTVLVLLGDAVTVLVAVLLGDPEPVAVLVLEALLVCDEVALAVALVDAVAVAVFESVLVSVLAPVVVVDGVSVAVALPVLLAVSVAVAAVFVPVEESVASDVFGLVVDFVLVVHYTDRPIYVAGQRVGYLQISESNAYSKAYVRKTVIRTAVLALLLAAISSALAYLLGMGLVGRPMARLAEKARRIGKGDLTGPLEIGQRDEIGELAKEMNAMCERLHDAREALLTETEGRLRAVEQVRHADRLATVGKLASGIAHELGTPMGVALVRANQIAESQAPREVREAGRIIGEQMDRMTTIVRQLLDFARGRAGTAPFTGRMQIDLQEIAQRTIEMLQPMADKRGITISFLHDDPLPRPRADSEQIQQMMVNLVVNAIHAFDRPGHIRISIEHAAATPPAHLGVPCESGCYACVVVEDQGVGIAPNILPRIFEPFFTTKDVGEGTGLGLSVVYGIVREHGGWIDVHSAPGKGSRFIAFLPMSDAKVVARA